MSPTLSRRAMLAAAATVPAVTAMPLPALSADADAELLQLGVELDAVIVERQTQMAIDQNRQDTWTADCAAAGLPTIEFGSLPDDEWRAYEERRWALLKDDDPVDEHGCSGSGFSARGTR
jgi:hypothetical protein